MVKQPTENSGEDKGRAEYIFYFSATLLSAGLIVYMWLQSWAYMRTGDGLSLAAFPTFFAAFIFITSITGAVFKRRQKDGSKLPTREERLPLWPVVLLTGGVLASTFGLWNFDAIITSILLVLILLLAGKVRDWRLLTAIPVGMGALVYILFVLTLGVYFPHGWFR